MKRYTFFVFLIVIRCINLCRLCLVAVKRFPENTYFPEMLISGKGKFFHVFGCISKNFPENIFWCLEKKKENTNQKTQATSHNPEKKKSLIPEMFSVRRPGRDRDSRSRSRRSQRDRDPWSWSSARSRSGSRSRSLRDRYHGAIAITARSSDWKHFWNWWFLGCGLFFLGCGLCFLICVFLLLFQTPENIFRKIFWNATKHQKTFSFSEN